MKIRSSLLFALIIITGLNSCRFGYSFNGGSVPIEAKTFSVKYFTNKAPQANPKYSRDLSEKLIDLLNSQTRLDFSEQDGDIRYEGYISNYRNSPVAVNVNENASQERLTISVHLTYVNTIDPAKNIEATVTHFIDYDPNVNFDTIEDKLASDIMDQLAQKIYDKSLGDW